MRPILWMILVTMAAPCVAQGDAHAVIRLRTEGIVQGNLIRLGEIAEIVSNDAAREESLAGIELGPAPEAGASRWIDLHGLRDDLYRKGVNLTTVEFAGSRRVEVKRPDLPAPIAEEKSVAKESKDWNAIVLEMLEKNVAETGPWEVGSFRLRILGDHAIEILKETNPSQWDLVVSSPWQEGRQKVTLEIPSETGKSTSLLEVVIEVDRQVVVTTGNLKRGHKITLDDLKIEPRPLRPDCPIESCFVSADDVVGLEVLHPISAEDIVLRSAVHAEPIVFRGSAVTVWIRQGTAELQLAAIAEEDGGLGEWIHAMNPDTRKRLTHKVRVIAAQVAELPQSAPYADGATAPTRRPNRSISRQGN